MPENRSIWYRLWWRFGTAGLIVLALVCLVVGGILILYLSATWEALSE